MQAIIQTKLKEAEQRTNRLADFDPDAEALKLKKKYKLNQDVAKIQEKAIE